MTGPGPLEHNTFAFKRTAFKRTATCKVQQTSMQWQHEHQRTMKENYSDDTNGVSDDMRTALVVDDCNAERVQTTRHLESFGFQVLEADDGFQALLAMRAQDFALVLFKLRLTRTDGCECVLAFRSWEKKHRSGHHQVLCGMVGREDQADPRWFAVGLDDVICTPPTRQELAALVQQQCGRKLAAQQISRPMKRKTTPSALIVDNRAVERLCASRILHSFGYAVSETENLEEGMEAMLVRPYSLVLAALEMNSKFNALNFVKQFREWEQCNNAKSGRRRQFVCCVVDDEQKVTSRICLEGGMDEVISSPYDVGKLRSICQTAVRHQSLPVVAPRTEVKPAKRQKKEESRLQVPYGHQELLRAALNANGVKLAKGDLATTPLGNGNNRPFPGNTAIASMFQSGRTDPLREIEIAQSLQGSNSTPMLRELEKAEDSRISMPDDEVADIISRNDASNNGIASLPAGLVEGQEDLLSDEVLDVLKSASQQRTTLCQLIPELHLQTEESQSANSILKQAISTIGVVKA